MSIEFATLCQKQKIDLMLFFSMLHRVQRHNRLTIIDMKQVDGYIRIERFEFRDLLHLQWEIESSDIQLVDEWHIFGYSDGIIRGWIKMG